ncbi:MULTISPECIES: patatin-like phospholipase family protein [Vibrio]|uniref:patatin-like phospholipase family protein n=1 Tax=Vibrio TaxID=662 RepID=UPI00040AA4FA|nr:MULTISPECIES: patatin-like phospholipase family protein [Vibrio]MDF4383536.1 patatin-like phospholipase family protein [Vibrio parahaemolyticus]MBO0206643.1 patatin-like phospholipase family protein [Vibrio sp. Vb0877]MBS9991598.1 patatin-like phospholipase family protein [Vibrio alginolyticus]MDW1661911.1 patatin-like phospholipase family protein [Vibrio sp. Vb2656]MDW1699652.1 patatin-like phospholipase family protein [Vibrio sp. Vb2657]
MSVGLVLSGGGAKGAYQVGVLKALAEMDIEVDKISGASIGALNSVIVASSGSTSDAAATLESIWTELGQSSPLEVNQKNIAFMVSYALASMLQLSPHPLARKVSKATVLGLSQYAKKTNIDLAVLDDSPIKKLFEQYVDFEKLPEWKDIWVSVFKGNAIDSIFEFAKGELLRLDTDKSEFVELKSLTPPEVAQAILASAALPILYPAKNLELDEEAGYYFDGGIGGAKKSQGNTPITPLVKNCDTIIVTHLDNGSNFDRRDFEGTIIDIRPSNDLIGSSEKKVAAMLDFSAGKIKYLIDCGFKDTIRVLSSIKGFSLTKSSIDGIQLDIDNLLDQL